MLRDSIHRSYDYEQTLTHWHYVRSGEMRNILPYSGTADSIINSAMPYELPLYKSKLFDGFVEWVEKYGDDPLRQDAYMRASRVHALLETITPESDDTVVPKNSVIREFIGGLEIE
jgi:uridine kinase